MRKMTTMKIVVHQNRDTRKVINTGLERQLIVLDRRSERHVESDGKNLFQDISNDLDLRILLRNKYTASRKSFQRMERETRYRMKMRVKRDLVITKRKFARLSIDVSTQPEDESIKSSAEPSAIQLREPVLQFSRSYENSPPPNINDDASPSTAKAEDQLTESLLEVYKCRMCPNFAVPEAYECPSGHLVCDECWLVLGHCTLCSKESSFGRVLGMERIAALLKFPCRWRGCRESLGSRAWRNHVDSCRHAEVRLNSFAYSASRVGTSSDYENEEQVDDLLERN